MDIAVNLLPWREQRIVTRRRVLVWTLIGALSLAVVRMGAAWPAYLSACRNTEDEQQALLRALSSLRREQGGLLIELQARREALVQRQQRAGQRENNQRIGSLLHRISQQIPPRLWLTRLEAGGEGFTLHGAGQDAAAVFIFIANLNQGDKAFDAVRVSLTNLRQTDGEKVAFILRGHWGEGDA